MKVLFPKIFQTIHYKQELLISLTSPSLEVVSEPSESCFVCFGIVPQLVPIQDPVSLIAKVPDDDFRVVRKPTAKPHKD
jgi:hypothetical protein